MPPEDIAGYRAVKAALSIPIAGGECEFTRFGFRELLVTRALDIVQPDTCAAGGLSRMQEDRRHGRGVRRPLQPACLGHRHRDRRLAAAARRPPRRTRRRRSAPLEPLLEFDRTEHPIRQALLTQPIEHAGGMVRVPDGPGLGIEVDRAALARFALP